MHATGPDTACAPDAGFRRRHRRRHSRCRRDDAGFVVGDPVVGRFGYLCPTRVALIPDSLDASRQAVPDGSVLLRIAASGDIDTVVRAYERLRDAGALAPLPRPLDRPTL
nr:hypothetical protein [Rhodococcus sp. NCIMB 12038]